MRLVITFVAACVLTAIPARGAQVGAWDVGGKVSVVNLGSTYGIKTAVKAEYRMHEVLTWRTDVEMLLRNMTDASQFDLSVPSNVLYYPLASKAVIDPYLGPGVTYTHSWLNRDWLGLNALVGVNFLFLRGKIFGIEGKYTQPLIPTPVRGTWEVGLTGSWELSF